LDIFNSGSEGKALHGSIDEKIRVRFEYQRGQSQAINLM